MCKEDDMLGKGFVEEIGNVCPIHFLQVLEYTGNTRFVPVYCTDLYSAYTV